MRSTPERLTTRGLNGYGENEFRGWFYLFFSVPLRERERRSGSGDIGNGYG